MRKIERITEMKSLVIGTLFFCALFFCAECFAFNCRISTTPVSFGTYDVFSQFVLDSTGTISVSCNNLEKKPMSIKVTLSAGNSGVFNPREMRSTSGMDRLKYYLFSDPAMTTVWETGPVVPLMYPRLSPETVLSMYSFMAESLPVRMSVSETTAMC